MEFVLRSNSALFATLHGSMARIFTWCSFRYHNAPATPALALSRRDKRGASVADRGEEKQRGNGVLGRELVHQPERLHLHAVRFHGFPPLIGLQEGWEL